ncbi:hypothetical protein ABB37_05098 [Leptomonas pyrrhocoris]|uniref:Uncharacterized protein n=1 Tax=Leptomonas pyrrhocoris TaxID=157538 RepID=A0A0M9G173_LEPPY|nr:hypothetical protein ABB37_05098 [Leptomonas pyrrhocoris]KPA80097.1 hypothetical protein ABB37_05098 [Leptomonas pyrrhocoris]|eukprot:XP_015658536.1 hypothetical protein ABB37_05098 [Leptomonas pyrrhocoris]
MSSHGDLTFHAPAAALVGVDAVGATSNGMFSRLHLVGNPDWMSSFSTSQQVAAVRPVLAPPVPVASAPRPLAAPAAIDAPAPAAKGFFSMFYRAPTTTSTTTHTAAATPSSVVGGSSVSRSNGAASTHLPAPPKSLDSNDSPPLRAMPVDAQLSLEHFSKSGVAEVSLPAARREPPRPLALGSDTWNALSAVPLPPKTSATGKRVLSPPVAIDGMAGRAPKPLWSDLSFTSCFRSSAPTLDAFRNVAPAAAPVKTNSVGSAAAQPALMSSAMPVPPKPVTTSPLRGTASSLEAAAATVAATTTTTTFRTQRGELKAHPLVPVGEDALPVSPLLTPVQEAAVQSVARVEATPLATPAPAPASSEVAAEAEATLHRDVDVASVLTDFVKSITEPATQQEEKEEALAAANVRNFLSTIFSHEDDTDTSPVTKADAFNALELVINRGSTQPKPTQPLAYSTFASSPLFMDNNDEDSEEGLERLRRVVSIVMQAAKTHDGGSSQPSSQTQRRNGGGVPASPPTGKYTEFSATYHAGCSTGNENEWMQYARF